MNTLIPLGSPIVSPTRAHFDTVPQTPFELERSFTHRLHTLTKVTDRVTQSAYLTDADIGFSEGRCLAAVGAFSPLSINDLAARANLDKGQASRAAQALVDQGWVRKAPSPSDRRGVVLTLTATGKKRWDKLQAVIAQRNADILACLNPTERETLSTLLDRLLDHAQTHATPRTAP